MRKAGIAGLGIVFACLIVSGWAWADIEGSKHDFSNQEWTEGDKCSACHGPERAAPPAAAPLWDAKADLNRVFGTSLTHDRQAGNGTLVCLRCHDGTIAKDTVSDQAKERFAHRQHPGIFTAGHQRSDHPVGVDYPRFDKGYHPASTVIASGTVTLPDDKVECISCHDPHDSSGVDPMLVTSNVRSALCLTCHKK